MECRKGINEFFLVAWQAIVKEELVLRLDLVTFMVVKGPSIKPGTWNIPEHSGTSNNYDDYEKKKMCKLKFWACSRGHLKRLEWSRRSRNMFLFASRITLLRNESYGRTFHRGKKKN